MSKTRQKLCAPHDRGVRPEYPPFFYEGCPACEAKKAAGKVTGEEGPLSFNWGDKRPGPWRRSRG